MSTPRFVSPLGDDVADDAAPEYAAHSAHREHAESSRPAVSSLLLVLDPDP